MDDVKVHASISDTPIPGSDLENRNLGPTKRRIVERLKRADAKVSDLARALDMTEAGVRQHLDALADNGLVVARTGPAEGRGRPPTVWALTDLAQDLFPDRHDDLTVELITAVRTALGDQGLAAVQIGQWCSTRSTPVPSGSSITSAT